VEHLAAVELLPSSVFLDDHEDGFLEALVGGEALLASGAFTPSTNRALLVGETRIEDSIVGM